MRFESGIFCDAINTLLDFHTDFVVIVIDIIVISAIWADFYILAEFTELIIPKTVFAAHWRVGCLPSGIQC